MIAAMFGDLDPIPELEVSKLLELAGIPDAAIERSAVAIVRQGLAHGIRATRPDLARQVRQALRAPAAGASSGPAGPSSSEAPPRAPAGPSSGPAAPALPCPLCGASVRLAGGRLTAHGDPPCPAAGMPL